MSIDFSKLQGTDPADINKYISNSFLQQVDPNDPDFAQNNPLRMTPIRSSLGMGHTFQDNLQFQSF